MQLLMANQRKWWLWEELWAKVTRHAWEKAIAHTSCAVMNPSTPVALDLMLRTGNMKHRAVCEETEGAALLQSSPPEIRGRNDETDQPRKSRRKSAAGDLEAPGPKAA